ncbi:MAG TPA: GIY-YIG nuclease family protein [Candidatus Bathyarchaeia archaeon]|nr:GIY-YIG nuclease family protein [Candidatus Bathyarchaeia archaeon]
MTTVYVIKSEHGNYIYVGLTNNLTRRLQQHFNGNSATTRAYRPFTLIYKEEFEVRQEARAKEKYLKSGSGKEWLKRNCAGGEIGRHATLRG